MCKKSDKVPAISGRECGFTLTELLVVIASIVLLAALLLPGLSRAKANAQSIKCRSNLHQVGLALEMYKAENHGYPYLLTGGERLLVWTDAVATYSVAGTNDRAFKCPAFKGVSRPWASGEFFFEGPGYGYNDLGTGWLGEGNIWTLGLGFTDYDFNSNSHFPPVTEAQVKVPSEMFAVTDSLYVPWQRVYPGWNDDATSGLKLHPETW
jgi:type II secretory pathway pseudopilin PulG